MQFVMLQITHLFPGFVKPFLYDRSNFILRHASFNVAEQQVKSEKRFLAFAGLCRHGRSYRVAPAVNTSFSSARGGSTLQGITRLQFRQSRSIGYPITTTLGPLVGVTLFYDTPVLFF